MENINIPLVDVLSELLNKRVVMDSDDYVFFENLEKVSRDKINEAMILKEQKEKDLSVPTSITVKQARLALLKIGKLNDVATAINSLESPIKEQIQIEWEYATEIYRNHNFIETLGASLGLDKVVLDELFISGKSFV